MEKNQEILESGALDRSAKQPILVGRLLLSKCYFIYFGSYDHIWAVYHSKRLYHVIMFVGQLEDALSLGILYSVYKAGCCRSSGLGKKQVSLRHKRTKATQQDLCNHILLCKTNGIGYVPHSTTTRIGNLWAMYTKLLRYSLMRILSLINNDKKSFHMVTKGRHYTILVLFHCPTSHLFSYPVS